MSQEEYSQDKKIRKIEEDTRQFEARIRQIEGELQGIEQRLDAEVERFRAVAVSKKEAYENLRMQAQASEKAWRTSDKQFQKARGDKQKTISGLHKESAAMRKRIRDAEKAREKRIRDIEKKKQKEVDKAKKAKAKEMEEVKRREVERTEEEKKKELGMS
ncbi:MAG: hypothetical protein RTU30_09360 [Candidatus Thorarchaeota archaeon]